MPDETLFLGLKATFAFASIKLREQINLMAGSREKSLALTKLDELDYWGGRAAEIELIFGEGRAQ